MTAFQPASSSDEQPGVDEDPEAEKVSEPNEIETWEGGEADDTEALAKEALDKGLDPLQRITEGLAKGTQRLGNCSPRVSIFA